MGKYDKIGRNKIPRKDRWENWCYPLFPLLEVNHFQPILHMSKILVYIYTTDECIIKFTIGYMLNPIFHVNKVFR